MHWQSQLYAHESQSCMHIIMPHNFIFRAHNYEY